MKKLIWIDSEFVRSLSLKVLTLCFLTTWLDVASAATFTHRPLTYRSIDCDAKGQSFTFPFVESDDSLISNRINNYLHLLFLDFAPPDKYKETPMEIAANSWVSQGLRELKATPWSW